MWLLVSKLTLFLLPIGLIVVSVQMFTEEMGERKLDSAFQMRADSAEATLRNYSADTLKAGKTPETERVIGTVYRADIDFRTKLGAHIVLPAYLLDDEFVDKYTHGETIEINYLPEDPKTIRLAHHLRHRGNLFGVALLGIGSLCFLLFLFGRLRK